MWIVLKFVTVVIVVQFLDYASMFCEGKAIGKRSIGDTVNRWIFTDKCFGELGCFNNGPPFFDIIERPLSLIPSDREDIDTTFYLFTSANLKVPVKLVNTNLTKQVLSNTSFKSDLKTIFIVPGYISKYAPLWETPMKDALLKMQGCNVIIMDWSQGDGPLYEQAVANTRVVGAEIARFITFLHDTTGALYSSMHIIGHSLGAHIAGYAGKRIKNLGRITGLDPAGPYFENVDPLVRLNTKDALFVDVIHTDAATNRFSGFGTTESLGHFDFFPNGGAIQPGCHNLGWAVWELIKHPKIDGKQFYDIMCHHHRAIELMMSSISHRECDMKAVACDSWDNFIGGHCGNCSQPGRAASCIPMGYHADHYANKILNGTSINLYLHTTDTAPYCLEKN